MSARRRRRGPTPGALLAGFLAFIALLVVVSSVTSTLRLGLDLQGGIAVVLTAPPGTSRDVVDKAIDIIRNRVDALGVGEPEISRQGGQNILVQLPGVKDRDTAIRIIGTTAQLQFRPVLEQLGPPGTPQPIPATDTATPTDTVSGTTSATETAPAAVTPTAPVAITETTTGVTPPELDITSSVVVLTDTTNNRFRLGAARIVGSEVKGATAEQIRQDVQGGGVVFGGWQVKLAFTPEAEAKYKKLTGEEACKTPHGQIAIVLDHVVQTAPQVSDSVECNKGILGGGVITLGSGKDQKKQANELATVLKFGALPAPFQRSNIQEVSATLGRDSLRAGLIAGLVGLALVCIYSILYYRALGLVVVAGLGVFGALLYSLFSLLSQYRGLSLSLAGIAGVIVSIGITSDSYIVYFERVKEEVRAGRTIRSSVEKGFSRAFRTIFAADLVSFIAAAVLYLVAVSSVKGFALLLGIATILDMGITFFFTRNVVRLLLQTRWFSEARFIGVSHTSLGTEAVS